jgi:hypothetical protein
MRASRRPSGRAAHTPNRVSYIIRNQQRSALVDDDADWASEYISLVSENR